VRPLAALAAALAAAPAAACEVALALAVDVSGSVGEDEYRLQMDGIAAALTEPEVADALIAGRSAVMVIQWSGAGRQRVVVPWTRVADAGALEGLAAAVAEAERELRTSSTGIGEAMLFAAGQFDAVRDCGRRVIDVSGDGRSNDGREPKAVGAALAAGGTTVNGLAVIGSEPYLERYYRDNVIAGPGSFVVAARGFRDYPDAIRRKLTAELVRPTARASGAELAEARR
jgi:Ca-activated chloride channel family protein